MHTFMLKPNKKATLPANYGFYFEYSFEIQK